jgi:cobalt-zinc-cadmium efflux system protein
VGHDHEGSAGNGGHRHAPNPGLRGRTDWRPLAIALAITAGFVVVEAVGGLLTGSLALLADAGHMATDAAALGLALVAVWLARRPATPRRSFGFARAETLAALLNAAALVVLSLALFWEVARRIGDPPPVDSGSMLAVAVAGLAANAVAAWILMRGGGHDPAADLNTRGAFLHVLGDLLGSAAAIVAALVMLATGWRLADPLLSGLIGLLVLRGAWRLLRDSAEVLLEATPPGIDPAAVRAAMAGVAGVAGVHDLHVWTVTSGVVALGAHVEVDERRPWPDILVDLGGVLRRRFGIAHLTLQPEPAGAAPFSGCTLETPEGLAICRAGPGGGGIG